MNTIIIINTSTNHERTKLEKTHKTPKREKENRYSTRPEDKINEIDPVRPSLKNKIKGQGASTWTNPKRQLCFQAKSMATKVPARADPATKVLPTENAAEGDGGASLPPEGEGAGELGGAGGESAAGPGD